MFGWRRRIIVIVHDQTLLFMKSKTTALLFIYLSLALSVYSQGIIQINFDGPPTQPPGSAYTVTNYSEAGMLFRPMKGSYGFGRVFPGYPADPQNGTAHLVAAFTQSLMFYFANDSVFDLLSVDLAEYSTGFANEPVTVQFIGYHPDGSTVIESFTTDGIIDGTGPLADFQTFNFTGFTDLSRVEVPTYGWSLDNLVVSVPEPASNALLTLGGLLLGAWRLRRRR
jgi:hypothetical protein